MQRLATRLRGAVSTLRTEVPPTPITSGTVMPAGTMD
jgi:hypothetical protein